MIKKLILLIVFMAFVSCNSSSEIKKISSDNLILLDKNKDIQVVDVRRSKEYNSGHITGAINIDFYKSSFVEDINKLDKSKTTVVYCKSGNRSNKSALIMDSLGFTDFYDFSEGINGWIIGGNKIIILDSLN
ncbi:MAG: rhodanese-like domain-containing protein [Flavobacteriales bacterium]|jgi:rhodanese-related sulfurtransferase|tara:strand:+ start:17962 stop:18357 length:396 start_codon:yes stop_codon:yes gene_type:complete